MISLDFVLGRTSATVGGLLRMEHRPKGAALPNFRFRNLLRRRFLAFRRPIAFNLIDGLVVQKALHLLP